MPFSRSTSRVGLRLVHLVRAQITFDACDVRRLGHVIMNRLLMKLLVGEKRLPGGREHIRMKRWIGSIVLASLGTLALAQAPFTIVRPADGEIGRAHV